MLPSSKVTFTTAESVALASAMLCFEAKQAGIRALVIKGPIAVEAGLRGNRPSADVDVLIEPSRNAEFRSLFEARGWTSRYTYPTHPKITAPHSITLIHPEWPCDLDVHYRWPGFFCDPTAAFELLWNERLVATVANQSVDVPSWEHQALIVGLHALRAPSLEISKQDLALVLAAFAKKAHNDKFFAAGFAERVTALGAIETAGPLLKAIGLSYLVPPHPSTEFRAWQLQAAGVGLKGVGWSLALRNTRLVQRPALIFGAVFPPIASLKTTFPELVSKPFWILRAWFIRVTRGARDFVAVNRTIDRVTRED